MEFRRETTQWSAPTLLRMISAAKVKGQIEQGANLEIGRWSTEARLERRLRT